MSDPVERFLIGKLPPEADSRLQHLHAYWTSIRPSAQRLPGRQHFDPIAVPSLLPHIWLLDVTRDPLRYRYRLIGTEIARVMGRDYTRWWVDEVPGAAPDAESYGQLHITANDGVIAFKSGRPTFRSDRYGPWLERLLLPLAQDGSRVDIILAITAYGVPVPTINRI